MMYEYLCCHDHPVATVGTNKQQTGTPSSPSPKNMKHPCFFRFAHDGMLLHTVQVLRVSLELFVLVLLLLTRGCCCPYGASYESSLSQSVGKPNDDSSTKFEKKRANV